jgi:hypothetical protein
MLFKIWGLHGDDYEECCLLGYKTKFIPQRRQVISPLQSPAGYCYVGFEWNPIVWKGQISICQPLNNVTYLAHRLFALLQFITFCSRSEYSASAEITYPLSSPFRPPVVWPIHTVQRYRSSYHGKMAHGARIPLHSQGALRSGNPLILTMKLHPGPPQLARLCPTPG